MHTKCILAILLSILITAVASFLLLTRQDISEKNTQYENLKYSSDELGVEFDYPSNLSLSFIPLISDDGENYIIEGVQIDRILILRTEEGFERYKTSLDGHVPEENTSDFGLDKITQNGVTLSFTKYKYGDGQSVGNCLWSDNWISYITNIGNNVVAEIQVEEQTSCDSEKEFKYQTDPERINQAIEILKNIKEI